jgi:hypothetical protein
MEILYKDKIPSFEILGGVYRLLYYYGLISKKKDYLSIYTPVIEIFSENLWNMLNEVNKEIKYYKFSPGKMGKNLVKLYFAEMPIDYVLLEIDSQLDGKFVRYASTPVNIDFYSTITISK